MKVVSKSRKKPTIMNDKKLFFGIVCLGVLIPLCFLGAYVSDTMKHRRNLTQSKAVEADWEKKRMEERLASERYAENYIDQQERPPAFARDSQRKKQAVHSDTTNPNLWPDTNRVHYPKIFNLNLDGETIELDSPIVNHENGCYYFPYTGSKFYAALSWFSDTFTNFEVTVMKSDILGEHDRRTRKGSEGPVDNWGKIAGYFVTFREKELK